MDESQVAAALPSVTPFISPIVYVICFMSLIIILSMLKNFVSYGISIAVTEWMLNNTNGNERLKLVRWFVNSDQILEALERMEETLKQSSKKPSK